MPDAAFAGNFSRSAAGILTSRARPEVDDHRLITRPNAIGGFGGGNAGQARRDFFAATAFQMQIGFDFLFPHPASEKMMQESLGIVARDKSREWPA